MGVQRDDRQYSPKHSAKGEHRLKVVFAMPQNQNASDKAPKSGIPGDSAPPQASWSGDKMALYRGTTPAEFGAPGAMPAFVT